MSRQHVSSTLLLLFVGLALMGCGDGVVGRDHEGLPLVTLSGQMIPNAKANVSRPVRLALAWYPQWLAADGDNATQGPPQSVITDEVVYQDSFPANYRFHLYRPPPPKAIAPLADGLAGKGSFGILLAYQDGNGNGKLDPIPVDGTPVDRIIGSSLLGQGNDAFALLYVDTAQAESTGLRRGVNVIKGVNGEAAAVVPNTTALPLALTEGGPFFDALVCEAGWLAFLFTPVCGLSPDDLEEPVAVGFDGRVALVGSRLEVSLGVTADGVAVDDATVLLNGRRVPYDAARGAYVLDESDSTLVTAGGSFVLDITTHGASVKRTFAVPGDFQVTAPAAGATVSNRAPLLLRWTAASNATAYYVGFEAPNAGMSTLAEPGALTQSFDVAGVTGAARAFVEARIDGSDVDAFVTIAVLREQRFNLAE